MNMVERADVLIIALFQIVSLKLFELKVLCREGIERVTTVHTYKPNNGKGIIT